MAVFGRELAHGAIAGDAKKNPNAAVGIMIRGSKLVDGMKSGIKSAANMIGYTKIGKGAKEQDITLRSRML